MAQTKVGGGGQQENYDPNTGKYVKSDVGSLGREVFHFGSKLSSNDIENKLLNGDFGSDFKDYYENADAETKNEIIGHIHSQFDDYNTQQDRSVHFKPMDYNEYLQFQRDAINNSNLTPDELQSIHHYVGTGSTSFYLNTAMRLGYDEMLKQFINVKGYDPNSVAGDYLSRPEFEKFKKAMEKATHSVQAPRDMQVERYLGTGPIVSWFKDTGVLNGIPIENNGWHDKLQAGSYSLQDLKDRLTPLIGTVMPQDGSFMSFSATPSATHMGSKRGAKKKDILMKIDVPKGQTMHITGNTHESEGMFPNDIDLYIKDVQLERDSKIGEERVVIYYGIKQK